MLPLYNPEFLQLYRINVLNLGMDDLFTVIGLGVLFALYVILSGKIFPKRYVYLMKNKAMREVQKAQIKRQYIEDFEKII